MKSPLGVIVIGAYIVLLGFSGLARAQAHGQLLAMKFLSILLAVSLIICGVAIVRCRPWAPTLLAVTFAAALLKGGLNEWRAGEPVLGTLFMSALIGGIWVAVWAYVRSAIRDARSNASLPPPMQSRI